MLPLFVTWNPDPVLFSLPSIPILGIVVVRWYGLCWALGLLAATAIVQKIYTAEKLPEKWFDSLFLYVVIGTIVGARLGHCLFYQPVYYAAHPFEIIQIWKGGLASHGGTLGIMVGVWFYSRKIKRPMIWTLDRIMVAVGLTAALIRIGNLMNSEIYGKPTTLPWGFEYLRDPMWSQSIASGGSGSLPCHPTQIYEALVYLLVFGLAMWMFWKTKAKERQGLILGICLIIIFSSRFIFEYLKNVQEPFEVKMIATYGINQGQLLSIPFVIWGIWLVWRALKIEVEPEEIIYN